MLSTKQLQQPNNQVGLLGEQLAQSFLKQNSYHILDTNLRWKHLEVDIVALTPNKKTLVFIEVKTKRNTQFGHPSHAYSYAKMKACHTIGKIVVQKVKWQDEIRFDLISVILDPVSIHHHTHVSW